MAIHLLDKMIRKRIKNTIIKLLCLLLGLYLFNSHQLQYVIQAGSSDVMMMQRINDADSTKLTSGDNQTKIFTILAWTNLRYGVRGSDWQLAGTKAYETCPYKNCYGTNDKQLYESSDAVLFDMVFLPQVFPKSRPVNQKWIMHILESPINQGYQDYQQFNNLFNVTWTYHRKSDIWTNYSQRVFGVKGGLFVKKEIPAHKLVTTNYAAGKMKMAAWFVSHCNTKSKRENYVKNLRKHIDVDIYGKCGSMSCNQNNYIECRNMLERNYKFYLSFENSICDDYVTEKLWMAINLNIVPVVMGGFNYSELLPPKSYIDVQDYSSPKELAKFLKMLNKNDTLYNEYLQWKGRYDIVPHLPIACSVCEYLNKADSMQKTYDRLDLFWNIQKDCYSPEKFYKNTVVSSWY